MWREGGVRRMELLFLGTLVLIGLGVRDADGWHASSQCVQVEQANYNGAAPDANYKAKCGYDNHDFQSLNKNLFQGYGTIGTHKFKTTHFFLDASLQRQFLKEDAGLSFFNPASGQKCPYKFNHTYNGEVLERVDFCVDDTKVEIRTFAVKQNGVVMQGWLHFEIELMDTSDKILGIYVQVRDEWFNAIGEFVTKPEETCESKNPGMVTPSQFQILPCSAVGFREAKISNALFVVDQSLLLDHSAGMPFLSSKSLSQNRGIHFTWRLNEYWCNRHLRFRPEAIIFTQKMKDHNEYCKADKLPHVYRKAAYYWIFPKWYGSADIKLGGTTITCDDKVINYSPSGSNKQLEKNPDGTLVAPWLLDKTEESVLDNDYVAEANVYYDNSTETLQDNNQYFYSLRSCHANTRQRNQAKFSGRCTHHFAKTPSHDALQGCNLDGDAPEFEDVPKNLPTYNEYVHILTINRTRQCSTPCRVPANMADLIAIQQYNTSNGPYKKPQELKFTNIGATRHDSKVKKFWAARKFHGQLLTFWSMFLIPVGAFGSRYLKETAMSHACIGFHMWFWIHMATIILGGGMLGCAYLALYDLVNTFGRSLNEFSGFHRILSFSSMVLFVFMAVLGGFRTRSMPVRKVLLFLHSFLGFFVYFLNLIAMVVSTWIPASPSMANDCDDDGRPQGLSSVALVTMAWLMVDIMTHIGMTILQILVDRKYGVIRHGCYCPIVPFLPPESISDLKGKHFRKIIFLVYSLVAFVFALTVIVILSGDVIPEHCRNKTGPSTCDDPWGCSNWAQAYSHRYPRKPTEAPKAAN